MDIWEWVFRLEDELEEAGQEHASDIIDQASSQVLELNIDKVDSLIPEAIALSHSLKNPWLEVFFRHWEMRNRIGNKAEGETALADVLSLFEFAHGDETITCPQTICVTNDLASCYANIDGIGWAEERKAICNKAFERINAKWSCFHCLSCEYANALLDENKPQEALNYLATQSIKIIEVGESISEAIHAVEVKALLRLDKAEKALAIIEKCEAEIDGYDWPIYQQYRRILKAHTLAKLGRVEEAWTELPAWRELVPRYYLDWVKAINALIISEPTKNEWALGSALQAALDHFVAVGSYRKIIEVATIQIRLALARNSIWTAQRALAIANDALPKLKAPLGADQLLVELANQIDKQVGDQHLPVPANELMAWLEDKAQQAENNGRNPEQELELLIQAVRELPDEANLVETTVSALQACNALTEAEKILWTYVERNHQEESPIAYQLLSMLLNSNKLADIDKLADLYQTTQPAVALWCRIQQAFAKEDLEQTKALSLEMHELVPQYLGPLRMLVSVAVNQHHFADAEKWQKLIVENIKEDSNDDLWDLLTFSSANQDWITAREVAKRLELPLTSTDGVIQEEWGWVRIQVVEKGEIIEYLAHCTGPVTAVIKEPSKPKNTQHLEDWIVYDATQLAPVPESEEEKKYFIPLYRKVTTLQTGGFGKSWFVDGIYPGDEAFKQLGHLLEAKGWRIWIHSNDHYHMTDQFDLDNAEQKGIFFSITAPDSVSPVDIDRFLCEATEDWLLPVHWLKLAEAAGAPIEPHQEVIDRYKL